MLSLNDELLLLILKRTKRNKIQKVCTRFAYLVRPCCFVGQGTTHLIVNKLLTTTLPSSLGYLRIDNYDGDPLPSLPETLYCLILGARGPISPLPKLPKFLVTLKFLGYYDKALPELEEHEWLRTLYLGLHYHTVRLPKKLTHLQIALNSENRHTQFPDSLTKLTILNRVKEEMVISLKCLVRLKFMSYCGVRVKIVNTPLKLFHISSKGIISLDESITDCVTLKHLHINNLNGAFVGILPKFLKLLTMGEYFNQHLASLPESLVELNISHLYNNPLPELPRGLKKLRLGNAFNFPLRLPELLTTLELGDNFNQPLPSLPRYLRSLTFGRDFNHPLTNIPEFVEYLNFGEKFNHPLTALPNTLIKITLGVLYTHLLNTLPKSIRYFTFVGSNNGTALQAVIKAQLISIFPNLSKERIVFIKQLDN